MRIQIRRASCRLIFYCPPRNGTLPRMGWSIIYSPEDGGRPLSRERLSFYTQSSILLQYSAPLFILGMILFLFFFLYSFYLSCTGFLDITFGSRLTGFGKMKRNVQPCCQWMPLAQDFLIHIPISFYFMIQNSLLTYCTWEIQTELPDRCVWGIVILSSTRK